MKKKIELLKMVWVPVVGCIVVFGTLFYVLFQLPLSSYMILVAGLSLFLSIIALQECRKAARKERENYERYKELRGRIKELDDRVDVINKILKAVCGEPSLTALPDEDMWDDLHG
jgi:membrane protein implicated in regulation of membrane protease activity